MLFEGMSAIILLIFKFFFEEVTVELPVEKEKDVNNL